MTPDELRKWLGDEPLVTLVLVAEVLADVLESRDFIHAAARVRDAQADMIAWTKGYREGVK